MIDRVVLFGGVNTISHFNDVWEWDGNANTWILRSSSGGPEGRSYAGMAYDNVQNVSVVFGGRFEGASYKLYEDTWTWDSSIEAWTNIISPNGSRQADIVDLRMISKDKKVCFLEAIQTFIITATLMKLGSGIA